MDTNLFNQNHKENGCPQDYAKIEYWVTLINYIDVNKIYL